jgi:uncharacterized membrane protein YeaQ/YmgE (transglycosylase-associated protein family)
MEYFWFVVIGLGTGLVAGQFLQGNNFFGVRGDVAFALAGALAAGIAFSASGIAPEGGLAGKAVIAFIGAFFALFLRRVLRVA